MRRHVLIAVACLLLAVVLPAQQARAAEPAPPTAVAVLPPPTLEMDAQTAKAAWDVVSDLLATKGYRVPSYADTQRALAQLELCPVRLDGFTPTGDPTGISWWRSNGPTDDDHARIATLCQTLRVSRVITLCPLAVDLTGKQVLPMYSPVGLPTLFSPEARNYLYSVAVAAWGQETGQCTWETTYKLAEPMRNAFGSLPVILGLRPHLARSAVLLHPVLRDALYVTLGEFFQRDREINGTTGTDFALRNFRIEQVKNRRNRVEALRLSWEACEDPRVKYYAIYRTLGDSLFPPYPYAIVQEPAYSDKEIDLKTTELYRYMVAALSEDAVEGRCSAVEAMGVLGP